MGLADFVARMTEAPARILKLPAGPIEPGREADLVVLDLKETWTCSSELIISRSQNSPFLGRTLTGRVKAAVIGPTAFRI
jgi:dihydroorotase